MTPVELRGLIVDWGGVLTAPLAVEMDRWARADGVDYTHFREVMHAWVTAAAGSSGEPSPVHLLERGQISVSEFEQRLAAALSERGSPVNGPGLVERMLGGLEELQTSMTGLVGRARAAGLRTALLSNSWGNRYPEHAWEGLFDAVVISGRVGMRKPEARIYAHTAGLLGLAPQECVMVDDLQPNVAGAVAVGMVGVLHRSYEETLLELEVIFDLRLH